MQTRTILIHSGQIKSQKFSCRAELSGRLRIRIRVFKIPEPEPTHEGSARPHALSVWYGDFAQSITEFGVNLQYSM